MRYVWVAAALTSIGCGASVPRAQLTRALADTQLASERTLRDLQQARLHALAGIEDDRHHTEEARAALWWRGLSAEHALIELERGFEDEPSAPRGALAGPKAPPPGARASMRGRLGWRFPGDALFRPGSAHLHVAGEALLGAIVDWMKAQPRAVFLVRVHDDGVRLDEKDDGWNVEKASALAEALLRRGLGGRWVVEAMGEFDPIDTNDSDEGRAANRRVEIVVVNPG